MRIDAISIGKRCFWNEVSHNVLQGALRVDEPANVVEDNAVLPQ